MVHMLRCSFVSDVALSHKDHFAGPNFHVERAWVRVARERGPSEPKVRCRSSGSPTQPQQASQLTTAAASASSSYGPTANGGILCCDATLVSPRTPPGVAVLCCYRLAAMDFVRLPRREIQWALVPIRCDAGIASWRPGWLCPGCAREVAIPADAGGPCHRCFSALRWEFDRVTGLSCWSCTAGCTGHATPLDAPPLPAPHRTQQLTSLMRLPAHSRAPAGRPPHSGSQEDHRLAWSLVEPTPGCTSPCCVPLLLI